MSRSEERLQHAELRAVRARHRLVADLIALKHWLMPRRLFGRLTRQAKAGGAQALAAGTDAVKARPGLAIGALALGALFLARKPIARALSREKAETPKPPARSPAKRATRAQTRKAKP